MASMATGQAQAQLAQQVGIKVAEKTMDVAKQQGEATVEMIQDAAQMQTQLAQHAPHVGNQLDITA